MMSFLAVDRARACYLSGNGLLFKDFMLAFLQLGFWETASVLNIVLTSALKQEV